MSEAGNKFLKVKTQETISESITDHSLIKSLVAAKIH